MAIQTRHRLGRKTEALYVGGDVFWRRIPRPMRPPATLASDGCGQVVADLQAGRRSCRRRNLPPLSPQSPPHATKAQNPAQTAHKNTPHQATFKQELLSPGNTVLRKHISGTQPENKLLSPIKREMLCLCRKLSNNKQHLQDAHRRTAPASGIPMEHGFLYLRSSRLQTAEDISDRSWPLASCPTCISQCQVGRSRLSSWAWQAWQARQARQVAYKYRSSSSFQAT